MIGSLVLRTVLSNNTVLKYCQNWLMLFGPKHCVFYPTDINQNTSPSADTIINILYEKLIKKPQIQMS